MCRSWLLIVVAGCGRSKAAADGADGTTDACLESSDTNGNGTPDACERELLGSFTSSRSVLESTSQTLTVQLAYDTDLAISQWVTFEPALELTVDDMGPVSMATAELDGWEEVELRLSDDVDEMVTIRLIGVDDGLTELWPWLESFLGVDLDEGASVNELSVEILDWESGQDEDAVETEWVLYGAPAPS